VDTVFFDLDGTLIDPKIGITRSIQYALGKLDLPVANADDLTWCIGPPLRTSMAKLVGEDLTDRAVALYRERFSETGIYESTVYEGVVETLAVLAGQGRRLFVATSKVQIYAERIIKDFNLARYFEGVFGAEMDGTRGDKTGASETRPRCHAGRSRARGHDRRSELRHDWRTKQWDAAGRRSLRLRQQGRTDRG
jgi:phosphoglycolate phosphatase